MMYFKAFTQSPGFCGPACIKMILDFYGSDKTEEEIAEICGANRERGVSLDGIVKGCNYFGLQTKVIDNAQFGNIREYVDKSIPVMVQWWSTDEGHWSIVGGIDDKNVYVQDPHYGTMRMFSQDWFYGVWFDFHKGIMEKENLILRRMIAVWKEQGC